MFEKRRKRKALQKFQEDCFHEYHIVSTYQMDVGQFEYKWVTRNDMYCPKCDKTSYEVSEIAANREIEKQKVRNNYKETY